MPRVAIDNYSNYYDVREKVQFDPVLDRRTGCRVGIAEVSADVAARYEQRRGFRLMSDIEFVAMTRVSTPAPVPATGQPLQDVAVRARTVQGSPPPPPRDRSR